MRGVDGRGNTEKELTVESICRVFFHLVVSLLVDILDCLQGGLVRFSTGDFDLAMEMPDQTTCHSSCKLFIATPVAAQGDPETKGCVQRCDNAYETHKPERVPVWTSYKRKDELIEESI